MATSLHTLTPSIERGGTRELRGSNAFSCCMLLLCALGLFASGCSRTKPAVGPTVERYTQALRDAVASNVPEGTRRTQMLSIVDQVEKLHLRFAQETTSFVTSYRSINADYDATRATLDDLFSEYEAQRVSARDEALALHMQLAALATASEWNAIAKAEQKLYEKVNVARQAGDEAK